MTNVNSNAISHMTYRKSFICPLVYKILYMYQTWKILLTFSTLELYYI